jgi:hypothetical protein
VHVLAGAVPRAAVRLGHERVAGAERPGGEGVIAMAKKKGGKKGGKGC